MSLFSSDTDPDLEDERCQFRPLQAPVSHESAIASMGVMESPSRYPEPAVPGVLSAVSSQGRSFYIRRYAAAYHLRFYIYFFKIKTSYLGLFISI